MLPVFSMKSQDLSLPNQRNYEYAYRLAYKLACEQLAKSDIEQQCLRSDAQLQVIDSHKIINLKYLNRSYQVLLPNIGISLVADEEEVPMRDMILILHYLTLAKGTTNTKKMIAYKELPGGASYFPTFSKRTIKPILDYFGKEPCLLLDAGMKLGGHHRADYGDVAITVPAFSRVPITIVLWRGDDEFDPRGSILFDSTVSDYLSMDDINVLCEIISWKLIKFLKEV